MKDIELPSSAVGCTSSSALGQALAPGGLPHGARFREGAPHLQDERLADHAGGHRKALLPVIDPSVPKAISWPGKLAKGIDAVPGAASGEIVFTARPRRNRGRGTPGHPGPPRDQPGGRRRHARGAGDPDGHGRKRATPPWWPSWAKCCIVGCEALDPERRRSAIRNSGRSRCRKLAVREAGADHPLRRAATRTLQFLRQGWSLSDEVDAPSACSHDACSTWPTSGTTAAWLVFPPVACQDPLRRVHAADVLRAGLVADQDDPAVPRPRIPPRPGGEDDLPARRPRDRIDPLRQFPGQEIRFGTEGSMTG